MCEHELRGEEAWAFLVNSLAAANARVAELEAEINNYLSFGQGGASFSDSQWLDMLAKTEQRAEQAEAQNKRMREALEQLADEQDGYMTGELVHKIAKAALEEKP